jgi:hypothetical protein
LQLLLVGSKNLYRVLEIEQDPKISL